MRALLFVALCSSCTFAVTATHADLQPTGNICRRVSDPRCAAMVGDLAAFVTGASMWSRAEQTGDTQYVAGLSVMTSILLANVAAAIVWPERM